MGLAAIRKETRGIKNEKDLKFVSNRAEREFARLILTEHPDFLILYEPRAFAFEDPYGRLRGTLPDFYIERPNSLNGGIYIEITTTARKELTVYDPKERQRRIMQNAAPGERYVVLYRENLQRIQSKFPWLDFGLANAVPVLSR